MSAMDWLVAAGFFLAALGAATVSGALVAGHCPVHGRERCAVQTRHCPPGKLAREREEGK